MIKRILERFTHKKIQTFTYFIPAPPARRTGYREKSFDSIIEDLVAKGFRILDINTCPVSNSNAPGLWIIVKLQSTSKESYDLKATDFPQEMVNDGATQIQSTKVAEQNGPQIELAPLSDGEIGEVYQID
jgi:hypothetical protein